MSDRSTTTRRATCQQFYKLQGGKETRERLTLWKESVYGGRNSFALSSRSSASVSKHATLHSKQLERGACDCFFIFFGFRILEYVSPVRTRTSWQIVLSSASIFFRYSSAMLCFAASLFCSMDEMTRHDDRRAPTTFL